MAEFLKLYSANALRPQALMMTVNPHPYPNRRCSAEATKYYIHSHTSKIPEGKTLALTGKQGTDLGQCHTHKNPGPGTSPMEALRHCCCTMSWHFLTPGCVRT